MLLSTTATAITTTSKLLVAQGATLIQPVFLGEMRAFLSVALSNLAMDDVFTCFWNRLYCYFSSFSRLGLLFGIDK